MPSYSTVSAASTNAAVITANDARILHYSAFNNASSARYIKFYAGNGSTAPTAGTTVPKWRVMVPAGGGVVAHFAEVEGDGLVFLGGLGVTITTGAADSDTTSAGASEVLLNVRWQ